MTAPTADPTTSLRPIPIRPDDLNPTWLTSVLRRNGFDGVVRAFKTERFGEGAGMMSLLTRIELDYASGQGPASVVIKMPSASDANRATAVAFHCYERETIFLRDVSARMSARIPKVFHADIEGEEDFVVVMEDMRGYDIGDQVVGCTIEQARLGMPCIAQFHASFWGKVDHPDYDFIPYHYPSYFSDAMHGTAIQVWDQMAEFAGDALPQELRDVKEEYLAAIPGLQKWATDEPRTIVQGDFRMDNLFFGTNPDQAPIALSDWQGLLRGKAAHDIAYFLSQSTPTELRRKHERELVALWHEGLVAGGVNDYSAEHAWEDYRRAVLCLWSYVTVIAGVLEEGNERGRQWMTEMVRRSAATIIDLGLLALLPEFEPQG
jgi:aminoglycoside/choline kinase family phosphotransferase